MAMFIIFLSHGPLRYGIDIYMWFISVVFNDIENYLMVSLNEINGIIVWFNKFSVQKENMHLS